MEEMREKLARLLKNAYSPYYKFPVAAIVVMSDGNEFCGVNVENANGTSICAERNAIANAVAHGYKKGDFKALYIMLASGKIGTPCFACRQVIQEFMEMDRPVFCVDKNGNQRGYLVHELCPYPFSEDDLQ